MGKNAQRRRGKNPQQPKIDHFVLGTDPYIAIRRYLGSRPHDETRLLIDALDQLPAVTEDDIQARDKNGARLAELEEAERIRNLSPADLLQLHARREEDEAAGLEPGEEVRRMASAGKPLISVESHNQEGGVTAGKIVEVTPSDALALDETVEEMASLDADNDERNPAEEIEEIGLATTPDPDADLATATEEE